MGQACTSSSSSSSSSSAKTALTLNYFPIPGRSVSIRAAVALAGDDFKSKYTFQVSPVSFEDWNNAESAARKDRFRFPTNDLPTITVADPAQGKPVVVAEAMAVISYVGQVTGFWPQDPLEVARCVEILATVEQFLNGPSESENDCSLIPSMAIKDQAKQMAMRRGPVTDRLKIYFGRADQICGSNGFAVGNKTTIIDFFLVGFVLAVKANAFDGVDSKPCDSLTNINKIIARVMGDAKMKEVINQILA